MAETIGRFFREHALAIVALTAGAVTVGMAVFSPILSTDTCCRYAPMAEAFAAGNWEGSFHPRFCIGMPVVSGIFCRLTGLDGYASCAAVSTLAWVVAVFPLFRLTQRIFGSHTAWFAVVLYLICPQILLWGLKGLKEPFRVLGLLLAVDALYECRAGGNRNLLEAALGAILLFFYKVDAIAYGLVFTVAYACLCRSAVRALTLALVSFICLSLDCALVYDWTGYCFPAPNYIVIWKQLLGFFR